MSADTEDAAEARLPLADAGENKDYERGAGQVGAADGAHVKHLAHRSRWQWLETPLDEPPAAAARKRQELDAQHVVQATNKYDETQAMEGLRTFQSLSVWFRGFNPAELVQLVGFCTFHILSPGETVTRAGEPASFLCLLVWGELDLIGENGELEDVIEPGAIVGESNVFFGGVRRSDLKSSPTGCVVATVAFADLARMHLELPKLTLKLLQRLAAVCVAKEAHAAREGVAPAALDAKTTSAAVSEKVKQLQLKTRAFGRGIRESDMAWLLAGWIQCLTIKKGRVVVNQGQRARQVMFVVSGSLQEDMPADGVPVRVYKEGDMLGADKFLLLDPSNTVYQAYDVSVSTASETLLALISYEQLEFMHAANPSVSVALINKMAMFALRQVDPSLMGLEHLLNQRRTRSNDQNMSIEVGDNDSDAQTGVSEQSGSDSDTGSDGTRSDDDFFGGGDALTSDQEPVPAAVTSDLLEYLRCFVEYFTGLTNDELSILRSHFQLRKVFKSDVVMRSGSRASFWGIVCTGTISVMRPDDMEMTLGPGNFFGEMMLFHPQQYRVEMAISTSDNTIVACFPFKAMQQLHKEHPDLGLKVLRMLASRTHAMLLKSLLSKQPSDLDLLKPVPWPRNAKASASELMIRVARSEGSHLTGWPKGMIAQLSRFCEFAELKGRDQLHLRIGTIQSAMVFVLSGEIKLLFGRGLATQTGSVKKGEWLSEAAILQVPGVVPSRYARNCAVPRGKVARVALISPASMDAMSEEAPHLIQRLLKDALERKLAAVHSLDGKTQPTHLVKGTQQDDEAATASLTFMDVIVPAATETLMKDRLVGFKYGTMWKNKKQHLEDALGDTKAAMLMMRKLKSRGEQKEELRVKLLSGARDSRRVLTKIRTTQPDSLPIKELRARLSAIQRMRRSWHGLSFHSLRMLAKHLSVQVPQEGQEIIVWGEKASFVAVVLEGEAETVMYMDHNHNLRTVLATHTAGDILGAPGCFQPGVRPAHVVAAKACMLALLPYQQLELLCTLDPTLSVELHQTLAHELFVQLSRERHRLVVYRLDKQQAARRSNAILSLEDPVFEPWDVERVELTERLRMAHEEARAAGKLGMGRALQEADFAVLCSILQPVTVKESRMHLFERDTPGRVALVVLEGTVRCLKPDGTTAFERSKGEFAGQEVLVTGTHQSPGNYLFDVWNFGTVSGCIILWDDIELLSESDLVLAMRFVSAMGNVVSRDKGNPQKELLLTTGQEKTADFQKLTHAVAARAMRKSVFWARAGQVVKNQQERSLSLVPPSTSSTNLNYHTPRTKMIAMKDVEALLNESQAASRFFHGWTVYELEGLCKTVAVTAYPDDQLIWAPHHTHHNDDDMYHPTFIGIVLRGQVNVVRVGEGNLQQKHTAESWADLLADYAAGKHDASRSRPEVMESIGTGEIIGTAFQPKTLSRECCLIAAMPDTLVASFAVDMLDGDSNFVIGTDPAIGMKMVQQLVAGALKLEWESFCFDVFRSKLPIFPTTEDQMFKQVLQVQDDKKCLGRNMEMHEVLALSEHMSIARVAMFDTIVTQGQTVNEIMIILTGTVEVGQRSPAGPAHSIGYLGRGDLIGIGVLIEGVLEPFGYGGSLLALDEVTLAVMTKRDFNIFMKKHTLIGRKFYAHLVAQYMRHWMLGASDVLGVDMELVQGLNATVLMPAVPGKDMDASWEGEESFIKLKVAQAEALQRRCDEQEAELREFENRRAELLGLASDDDLDLSVEAKGRPRRFSLNETVTSQRAINPEVQRNWRASVHNVRSVIQLRKSQSLAGESTDRAWEEDEDLPPFVSAAEQPSQPRPRIRNSGGDTTLGPKMRSRGAGRRASINSTEPGSSRTVQSDSKASNLTNTSVNRRLSVKVEDNRTGTPPKSTNRARGRTASQWGSGLQGATPRRQRRKSNGDRTSADKNESSTSRRRGSVHMGALDKSLGNAANSDKPMVREPFQRRQSTQEAVGKASVIGLAALFLKPSGGSGRVDAHKRADYESARRAVERGELVKVQTIRNIFRMDSILEADREHLSMLVEKFVFVEGVGLAARQPPVEMKERIQNRIKSLKAIELQLEPEEDSVWKQLGQEELGFNALPEYTYMEFPYSQTQQTPENVDPDMRIQVSGYVSSERVENPENVEPETVPLREVTPPEEKSYAAPFESRIAVDLDLPMPSASVVEPHQDDHITQEAAESTHSSLRATPSPVMWAPSQALGTTSETLSSQEEEEEEEENMDMSLPSWTQTIMSPSIIPEDTEEDTHMVPQKPAFRFSTTTSLWAGADYKPRNTTRVEVEPTLPPRSEATPSAGPKLSITPLSFDIPGTPRLHLNFRPIPEHSKLRLPGMSVRLAPEAPPTTPILDHLQPISKLLGSATLPALPAPYPHGRDHKPRRPQPGAPVDRKGGLENGGGEPENIQAFPGSLRGDGTQASPRIREDVKGRGSRVRPVQHKRESETTEHASVLRTSYRPPKPDPELLLLVEQERKERLARALSMYEPLMTEKNRPVLEFHQRMRCILEHRMVTSSIRAPLRNSEPQSQKPAEAYLSASAMDLHPRRATGASVPQACTPLQEFSTLSMNLPRIPLIKYQNEAMSSADVRGVYESSEFRLQPVVALMNNLGRKRVLECDKEFWLEKTHRRKAQLQQRHAAMRHAAAVFRDASPIRSWSPYKPEQPLVDVAVEGVSVGAPAPSSPPRRSENRSATVFKLTKEQQDLVDRLAHPKEIIFRDTQREDPREPGYGPPPKVLDLHQESQRYATWEQWSYDRCLPLFTGSKSGSKVSMATAEVPPTPPPDPVHAVQHRPESQHKLNLHPDQELFAPLPSMSESLRHASLSSMAVQHEQIAPVATSDKSFRDTGTDFARTQNFALTLKPTLGSTTVLSRLHTNTLPTLQSHHVSTDDEAPVLEVQGLFNENYQEDPYDKPLSPRRNTIVIKHMRRPVQEQVRAELVAVPNPLVNDPSMQGSERFSRERAKLASTRRERAALEAMNSSTVYPKQVMLKRYLSTEELGINVDLKCTRNTNCGTTQLRSLPNVRPRNKLNLSQPHLQTKSNALLSRSQSARVSSDLNTLEADQRMSQSGGRRLRRKEVTDRGLFQNSRFFQVKEEEELEARLRRCAPSEQHTV